MITLTIELQQGSDNDVFFVPHKEFPGGYAMTRAQLIDAAAFYINTINEMKEMEEDNGK